MKWIPEELWPFFSSRGQGQNSYRCNAVQCMWLLRGWIMPFDLPKMTSLAFMEKIKHPSNMLCSTLQVLTAHETCHHHQLSLKMTSLSCDTDGPKAAKCEPMIEMNRWESAMCWANGQLTAYERGWFTDPVSHISVTLGAKSFLKSNTQSAKWPSNKQEDINQWIFVLFIFLCTTTDSFRSSKLSSQIT